jgi:hypothetical protein
VEKEHDILEDDKFDMFATKIDILDGCFAKIISLLLIFSGTLSYDCYLAFSLAMRGEIKIIFAVMDKHNVHGFYVACQRCTSASGWSYYCQRSSNLIIG